MATAIRKFFCDYLKDCKNFDKVVNKMKILTMENGSCLAELNLEKEHTNPLGRLHGGLAATLVDCVSSLALVSHPTVGVETPVTSLDIHTSYLNEARLDDVIEINARTLRLGRTLGILTIDIRNKETKDLLAKGTHTLYILKKESAK